MFDKTRKGRAVHRPRKPARARVEPTEWSIERLIPGGEGFTRLPDGRVGFAPGAVPGDVIRVHELTEHKSWRRAERWELVRPSPQRVVPRCPVAGVCGGCDWMQLERGAQIAAKGSLLAEALARTGGFRDLPPIEVVSAGSDFGYRTRLELHVDRTGRVGLYAKHTHQIVEIPGCPVSEPDIERALAELRELARRFPGALGHWAEIELRVAPGGPRVSVALRPREPDLAPTPDAEALRAEMAKRWVVAEHEQPPAGDDQRWPLPGGLELRAPPGGFVQVNWAVNEEFVKALVEGARARPIARFIDLYCGAGNFSLPLLALGLSGVGVERSGNSIRAARRAAREAGLSDDAFIAADVQHELERRARHHEAFDLCVLDPPRTGAREAMPGVLALRPRFVALCSCDPVTLARDLRTLREGGYALESVTGFDMFPQTHHVEALVWLRAPVEPGQDARPNGELEAPHSS